MTALLQKGVLRTRHLPGFNQFYRGVYAGAVAASSRVLMAVPGVRSVCLHRGLSRTGWEPGLSDIDLVLVHEAFASAQEELSFLNKVSQRLQGLRSVFPMVGDLWLGTPAELDAYFRRGGLRAWEDVPDWKRLAGKWLDVPPLAESELKRRWLDAWVWLFLAHMELCRRYSGLGKEIPERREAQLRKIYLDVRRYSDFLLDASLEAPSTREEMRQAAPEAGSLDLQSIWVDSSLRLAAASRQVHVQLGGTPRPAAESAAEEAVVKDPPYHTFIFLNEGADAAAYRRLAAKLPAEPYAGVTMVLEPDTWSLLLQSSYLGGPLGWLGPEADGRSPIPVTALPEDLRWEIAAEAASWMALWWRDVWINPGYSNHFALNHLVTRALGLRLMLAGEPSGPFSELEGLLARSAGRFPEDAALFARLRSRLQDTSAVVLDSCERTALGDDCFGDVRELLGRLTT